MIQCSLPNFGPGALKYRDVAPSSVKMVSQLNILSGFLDFKEEDYELVGLFLKTSA